MGSDSTGRIHTVAVVQAAPVAFDTARIPAAFRNAAPAEALMPPTETQSGS